MNILLTGAAGQLGTELFPILSGRGRVIPTDRSTPPDKSENWLAMDIGNAAELEVMLNRLNPDLIVNAAAYTAVDMAETEAQTAFQINAELPGQLATWANRNNARLIHYSTDYVFNGDATHAYGETDIPDPQNTYGESKLAGELAIEASGCDHITLRTSWVYSSHGKNFVLSMLALARDGRSLKIVNDQHGCPTWARNLALTSLAVIDQWQTPGAEKLYGLFHYCDDRVLSWYDFSREIFSIALQMELLESSPDVAPIPSTEFSQPAKRPKWSVLDTNKIQKAYDVNPASFNQALRAVLNKISNRGSV